MQQQPMYGWGGYTPFAPQTKLSNWLSQESIDAMRKNLNQFSLAITEDELRESQCNHINNHDGSSSLIRITDNGEPKFQCTNCGTIFPGREYTPDQVKAAVETILDILNNAKVMYHSIDPSAALNFFQIMAFIKKIPMVYELATNDNLKFEKSAGFMPQYPRMQTPIMYNMMGFGMPQYAGYPMTQQPMPQNPWVQPQPPQMPQQPPCGPVGNPLFGGQPQQPMYGFNPWAQQPQQMPQQPPAQPQQPGQQQQPSASEPAMTQPFTK